MYGVLTFPRYINVLYIVYNIYNSIIHGIMD
nr:MAG TPA: hypothetical protein [Caudoviricetes sp.]